MLCLLHRDYRTSRMRNRLLEGFYLQEILVEPITGQVSGSGVSKHLSSRAVEVLLCLARRPRRLVTREDILEKVWGTADSKPEALNRAIGDIRNVLGDRVDGPAFIQTVPRRGYRLLVEPRLKTAPDDQDGVSQDVADLAELSFWKSVFQHGAVQAGIRLPRCWLAPDPSRRHDIPESGPAPLGSTICDVRSSRRPSRRCVACMDSRIRR